MNENNAIPNGFRMTEIGPLPEEWDVVKIKELAYKMKAGGTPSRKDPKYWGGDIPFVLIEDMTSCGLYLSGTKERITEDGLKNSSTWIVPPYSLLLSMYATIGETAINTIPLTTNQAILAIIPKTDLDLVFSAYVIKFHANRLIMENIQSTQKNVNKGIVENFKIPLPPLPEQHAIASVLSTVQQAKEKTEAVILATKALKKSLMKHLFTYGPVPLRGAEQVPLKETEIGEVPEEWETTKIGDVFNVKQGKQLSSKENSEAKIKKPFLRTSNVFWGKIDTSTLDSMPFTLDEFEKLNLRRGDVLVCEGGDIGRTALWDGSIEECAYQNHLHRLRSKDADTIDHLFFALWMEHGMKQRKLYIFEGNVTTIPNLSSSRLKNFKIPLPPLPEQQKIASILSAVENKTPSGKFRAL